MNDTNAAPCNNVTYSFHGDISTERHFASCVFSFSVRKMVQSEEEELQFD